MMWREKVFSGKYVLPNCQRMLFFLQYALEVSLPFPLFLTFGPFFLGPGDLFSFAPCCDPTDAATHKPNEFLGDVIEKIHLDQP